jgi:hypothetical protein
MNGVVRSGAHDSCNRREANPDSGGDPTQGQRVVVTRDTLQCCLRPFNVKPTDQCAILFSHDFQLITHLSSSEVIDLFWRPMIDGCSCAPQLVSDAIRSSAT